MKVMAYQHALLLGLQTLCHAHERKRRAHLQYHQHSFCEPKHVAEDTKGVIGSTLSSGTLHVEL